MSATTNSGALAHPGILVARLGLFLTAVSCTPEARARPESTTAQVWENVPAFEEGFNLVDSVRLSPPKGSPLIRISGIARDLEGRYIVSDPSEAKIYVFDREGRYQFSAGRRGDGPGEFRTPAFPDADSAGSIHVADLTRRAIVVFDKRGQFLREIKLSAFSRIDRLSVGANGSYLLAGTLVDQTDQNVLFELDDAGQITRRWLQLANERPRESGENAAWRMIARLSLAVDGTTAYVVHTLLDSIWAVDLETGAVSSTTLQHPDYQSLSLPERQPRSVGEAREWVSKLLIATAVVASENTVAVGYVRGFYFDSPSTQLGVRVNSSAWERFTAAPPMLSAADGALIGLLTPGDTQFVIGTFRRQ